MEDNAREVAVVTERERVQRQADRAGAAGVPRDAGPGNEPVWAAAFSDHDVVEELTFAQLRRAIEDGHLNPHDRVWRQGMQAWCEAGTLEELAPYFSSSFSSSSNPSSGLLSAASLSLAPPLPPVRPPPRKGVLDALVKAELTRLDTRAATRAAAGTPSGHATNGNQLPGFNASGGTDTTQVGDDLAGAPPWSTSTLATPTQHAPMVFATLPAAVLQPPRRQSDDLLFAQATPAPSQRAPSQRAPSQRAPSQRAPAQQAPSQRGPALPAPTLTAPVALLVGLCVIAVAVIVVAFTLRSPSAPALEVIDGVQYLRIDNQRVRLTPPDPPAPIAAPAPVPVAAAPQVAAPTGDPAPVLAPTAAPAPASVVSPVRRQATAEPADTAAAAPAPDKGTKDRRAQDKSAQDKNVPPADDQPSAAKPAQDCDPVLDLGCERTVAIDEGPGLAMSQVLQHVKARLADVRGCGAQAGAGIVKVGWTITPDGGVEDVRAAGEQATTPLGACVTARVRNWIFPAALRKTDIAPIPFKIPAP